MSCFRQTRAHRAYNRNTPGCFAHRTKSYRKSATSNPSSECFRVKLRRAFFLSPSSYQGFYGFSCAFYSLFEISRSLHVRTYFNSLFRVFNLFSLHFYTEKTERLLKLWKFVLKETALATWDCYCNNISPQVRFCNVF